jgi:hypothetical protein
LGHGKHVLPTFDQRKLRKGNEEIFPPKNNSFVYDMSELEKSFANIIYQTENKRFENYMVSNQGRAQRAYGNIKQYSNLKVKEFKIGQKVFIKNSLLARYEKDKNKKSQCDRIVQTIVVGVSPYGSVSFLLVSIKILL